MFVVICENPEDQANVYGPFENADKANAWIETEKENSCPNEHYSVQVEAV